MKILIKVLKIKMEKKEMLHTQKLLQVVS